VGLGDRQVLVVAGVRDQRAPPVGAGRAGPGPGQVEALQLDVDPLVGERRGRGLADLELDLVGGVEGPVGRVVRTAAVDRVQVERGRAALHQVVQVDVRAEPGPGAVQRQVVVDELAEVGEPGRDDRVRRVRLRHVGGHRGGQCDPGVLGYLRSLRAQSREPEPPQLLDAERLPGRGPPGPVELQHPLTHYEEALDAVVLHPVPPCCVDNPRRGGRTPCRRPHQDRCRRLFGGYRKMIERSVIRYVKN